MKILREKEVRDTTGLSRVTRWRMIRRGAFPTPVKLSERCIGWIEEEVEAWLRSRAEVRQ